VVGVRPLASAWLANHVLEVVDGAGVVHRVVLRRWARPGWDEEDPDFTAAREAAILELLAPTPAGPALVPAYHRFYEPEQLAPPAWTARPGLWTRAFEVATGPPPPYPPCFIHRDYHPANTLWEDGRLAGVVDWVGGSWGPPSVDLGHMRLNLVWDLGPEAADRFLAAHHALTGADHHPHWDLVAAADCVPELDAPGPPEPWLQRMEDWVAATLARLGG
jgi:phosphotransferase family enzyme